MNRIPSGLEYIKLLHCKRSCLLIYFALLIEESKRADKFSTECRLPCGSDEGSGNDSNSGNGLSILLMSFVSICPAKGKFGGQ